MRISKWLFYKLIGRETTGEYAARHRLMERNQRLLEQARDDLVRVRQGYRPGRGYVASNGRVYDSKETPEEYTRRKLRSYKKMIDDCMGNFWR